MGKGDDWERKLINELDEAGWGVLRSAGSGSGTDGNRVDFAAGLGDRLWVVEAKYKSARNIYVEPEEVEQLIEIAEAWPKATPIIAARWNSQKIDEPVADWYLFNPFKLPRTDGGNYAVRASDIEDAQVLAEVL